MAVMKAQHCHGTATGCNGTAMTSWDCHGTAKRLSPDCYRGAMPSLHCDGTPMPPPWHCGATIASWDWHDTTMGYHGADVAWHLSWHGNGFMALRWNCRVTAIWECFRGFTTMMMTLNVTVSSHYHGTAMHTPWNCHEAKAMTLPWDYHGIPWYYRGTSMGLLLDSHGVAMGRHKTAMASWHCHTTAMALSWDGYETMGLPWDSMGLTWGLHGTAVGRRGISMASWDCHETAMDFHTNAMGLSWGATLLP